MRRLLALISLASAFGPSNVQAQPPPEVPPTVLTIRPAAEPRPVLKYRVVPERITQIPGNAAIFYHRALQMAAERRTRLDAEKKAKQPPGKVEMTDEEVYRWLELPIGEMPVEPVRSLLETYWRPLDEVAQGTTRTTCDWEFDRRPEGINLLLPEIQEMRSLARLVTLRARLAVVDGKTDEAIHWVETGLVLGRHVGKGPIVIQALVGIAIDSVMLKVLEELIQAPGTPSLVWALADRPRPFIDMRESFDAERNVLEKEIPGLTELSRGIWGVDQARKFADELQRKIFSFESGKTGGSTSQRMAVAAMTAKIYPTARKALIAQGRPEAEIEAMPVVQVASLYSYQEYRRILDESYKWMNIPIWQSMGRFDAGKFLKVEEKMVNPLLTMFWSLTPALESARMASVRLDRRLDLLQCIEAIRLHAGTHGGQWPETLDALTDAPAPVDPGTNKPFVYKLEGDSATITAPVPAGNYYSTYGLRYVLKRAR